MVQNLALIADAAFMQSPATFTEQHEQLQEALRKRIRWSNAEPIHPNQLMGAELHKPIRFTGHITMMSQPRCPEQLAEIDLEIVDFFLTPTGLGQISCLALPAEDAADLYVHLQQGQLLEFAGFFTRLPEKRGKNWSLVRQFVLGQAKPVTKDQVRVQATSGEQDHTATILKKQKDLLPWLRESIQRKIGVSGLDKAPELRMAMDAIILQAVSMGAVGNVPGKLHTLVIGSPGTGKKLLTRAAESLNPAFSEVQPAKCTVPGIQSTAEMVRHHYVARPGLIPIASSGVCCFQDFHQVKAHRDVLEVFNMVMEDGKLIDGSAAKTAITADTALHVDLNRQSHLNPMAGGADPIRDIGIELHSLSRFDVIVEIPRDRERQMAVVSKMLQGRKRVGGDSAVTEDRELKVLVATLRDKTPEVEIPANVVKLIKQFVEVHVKAFPNNLISDFLTRLSNSAQKLVAARARLRMRKTASVSDWTDIKPMLENKIQFLRGLLTEIEAADSAPNFRNTTTRRQFLKHHFKGQLISAMQIVETVSEVGNTTIDIRTAERDLNKIARQERYGKWRVAE